MKTPTLTRLLATAALLLTPASPLLAQSAAPAEAPAPATAPAAAPAATAVVTTDADPALWVVRDADTTIYLFGTVHVLQPGMSWFDEGVADAFNGSDEIVFEIPQDDDPAAMQGLVAARGVAQDGRTVTSRLTEAQRATYTQAMDSIHMPVPAFEPLEAWVPGMILSIVPLMQRGYDPAQGAERILFSAAQAANKRVSALETADMQLGFIDGLPEAAQISFLVDAAEQALSGNDQMEQLTRLWAAGNADELGALLNAQMADDAALREALLTRRNANWTQWINARLAENGGKFFVAVGAGHLAGADSVQAMLARDGVTVTRVNY